MNKNDNVPPLEANEVQFQEIYDPRALERNHPFRKNIYPITPGTVCLWAMFIYSVSVSYVYIQCVCESSICIVCLWAMYTYSVSVSHVYV